VTTIVVKSSANIRSLIQSNKFLQNMI